MRSGGEAIDLAWLLVVGWVGEEEEEEEGCADEGLFFVWDAGSSQKSRLKNRVQPVTQHQMVGGF